MGEGTDERDRMAGLVQSQREFYDLRAPDFGDATVPDRRASGMMPHEVGRALVDELAPPETCSSSHAGADRSPASSSAMHEL